MKIKLSALIISLLLAQMLQASLLNPHLEGNSVTDELSMQLDIKAEISLFGAQISSPNKKSTTYIGEYSDIAFNFKIHNGASHNCGAVLNFLSDRSFSGNRNEALHKAYIYYIFDYLGEIRIGSDRGATFYNSLINETKLGYDNRKNDDLSMYTIDHCYFRKYSLADDNIATKVLWISPVIKGFKVTCSYTPDTTNVHFCPNNDYNTTPMRNLLSGAISYQTFSRDGFYYKAALGGGFGRSKDRSKNNLKSYFAEVGVGYGKTQIILSYIDNCKSLTAKNLVENAGKIYNINATYSLDKWDFLLGYYTSRTKHTLSDKRIGTAYRTLVQYNFSPSWSAFIEYRRLTARNNTSRKRYRIVCSGVRYSFSKTIR